MQALNILILVRLGSPHHRRISVEEFEYKLPLSAPNHNYLIVDYEYPITETLKKIKFDVIIFGPTFLGVRINRDALASAISKFQFLTQSSAVKIAFPQDDYWCSAVTDDWLMSWDFDALYTLFPDQKQRLYPKFSKTAKPIEKGYTGYISETSIDQWRNPRAFADRCIDVSYRAKKKAFCFDDAGYLKGKIGERFVKCPEVAHLTLDIKTAYREIISGKAWHGFIENSRFCLATPSGSSVHDPYGRYHAAALSHVRENPNAEYDEVLAECKIQPRDKHNFTTISPRNLEAALAGTIQIATLGAYEKIFEPDLHFIPLEEDCSNVATVVSKMKDTGLIDEMIGSTKELILSCNFLRLEHHVSAVFDLIEIAFNKKNHMQVGGARAFQASRVAYYNEVRRAGFNESIAYPQLYSELSWRENDIPLALQ